MSRSDDARRKARREQHLQRLASGRDPQCARCRESEPAALVVDGGEVLCYECQAEQNGRSVIERHHIAGRHNDPATVALPGNAHRLLSDEQRAWPVETLRNPTASPLRQIAAWIRGWLDLLRVVAVRLTPFPVFLERLDDDLTARDGEGWWRRLERGSEDDRDS